jgi:Xaa-Pro aminopeptidase
VILPISGKPIAVIPSIGAHLMNTCWVDDIRTWSSPDYDDDGIGLLSSTLQEVVPTGGKIGLADGLESYVRMPLASLRSLEARLRDREIVSDNAITRRLRLIKSEAEIAKIAEAAKIGNRSFDRVAEFAETGTPLAQVFRDFQRVCLEEGADWVPYLAGAAGRGGYGDVISPANDQPLKIGDVMMLDTGLVWDGYFCDFDRNFSVGAPSSEVLSAHNQLIDATSAAFEIAKPGNLISDLFAAMQSVADPECNAGEAGRLGHGLGMQLTEWPSIISTDHTPLAPGMVLTLEPSVSLGNGRLMVHEENIVIREDEPTFLSVPDTRKMRVI